MSDERSIDEIRRWRDLWKKRYISLRGQYRCGKLVRAPSEFIIRRDGTKAWSGEVLGGIVVAVGKTPREVAEGLMDGVFLLAKNSAEKARLEGGK